MTLSVLMPAFNERDTIEAAIEQVLSQAIVSQVIVVDDGSTDGTREKLQEQEDRDPRVEIVFHDTNLGK